MQTTRCIVDTALAEITVGHPDFFIPGDQQTDARSRYADGYRLIQQNKTEIVNTAWTNTLGQYAGAAATEVKCKRDMGIFVDAVSLDLFVGGNKYSRKFIQESSMLLVMLGSLVVYKVKRLKVSR